MCESDYAMAPNMRFWLDVGLLLLLQLLNLRQPVSTPDAVPSVKSVGLGGMLRYASLPMAPHMRFWLSCWATC